MFNIGKIEIKSPLFLAPMAGVTDHPFRVLCKQYGAGVVYTEFVSANGIIRERLYPTLKKWISFLRIKLVLYLVVVLN